MGQLCSKTSQVPSNTIDTEKEVNIKTYRNNDVDEYYELQEKKYNLLSKINFEDFFYSLINFSNENATLEDDYNKVPNFIKNINFYDNSGTLYEVFPSDIFQSFIENKILKHKMIYEVAGKNEQLTNIFKEGFVHINEALATKLFQDAKEKDENADKSTIVKKIHLIAIGILYCSGANFMKLKILFNTFKNANGKIDKSDKFNEFLLALALIPSYCQASVRKKLSKYNEIGPFEKETLKKLINFSELKDCQNLVTIMNNELFGGEDSLEYDQFKAKFDSSNEKSVGYMLTPRGIRYKLIQNNV